MGDVSIGNGIGTFDLAIGATKELFGVGSELRMNAKDVDCRDSTQPGTPMCREWPSAIVPGKTVVTATCWWDKADYYPNESVCYGNRGWVCDQIDPAPRGSRR
jgi:hypothetical protein